MKTSQSFPFYPTDFLMGTLLMKPEEVGAYIRLLCFQWEQGSVPSDPKALKRITGMGANKLSEVLKKFQKCDDFRMKNEKMEKIRAEKEKFSEKQSENGSRGGRGNVAKHESQPIDDEEKCKAKPLPDESQEKAKQKPPIPSPSPMPSPVPNSISPGKREKGSSRSSGKEEVDPRFTQFRDAYSEEYLMANGAPYNFAVSTRWASALKRFLAGSKLSADDFRLSVRAAFGLAKSNPYSRSCPSVGEFHEALDRFNAIQSELKSARGGSITSTHNGHSATTEVDNAQLCIPYDESSVLIDLSQYLQP